MHCRCRAWLFVSRISGKVKHEIFSVLILPVFFSLFMSASLNRETNNGVKRARKGTPSFDSRKCDVINRREWAAPTPEMLARGPPSPGHRREGR